jgi:hypothetical protein
MQRLAFIACLLLGLTAIIGLGDVLVAAPYRANAERIAALQLEFEGVTQRIESAKQRLAAANSDEPIDVARLTMPGADPAGALAALQERVRGSVAAHGGQALSTVGTLADASGSVSRLAVGLNGRFEETALFAFLRELEGGTPPLVVDGLTVRALPAPGGLPLDVNVTLVSFGVSGDAP